jgi:predicted nucleic acid-binding protein
MIFVDSSAWIALSNPGDRHYDEAITIFNRLLRRRMRIVTTDYVIDESVTRLRYDLSHTAAVKFLDVIERTEQVDTLAVMGVDRHLFQEALRLFRQYDSARLSFTDCTSFAVCQKHKIAEVFAFDSDFGMMGITMLG